MSESRDPAIKLFGKTIPLPTSGEALASSGGGEEEKDLQNKTSSPESVDMDHESPESEEKIEPPTSSTVPESPKPSSADQENAPAEDSKPEESPNETNGSQEKTLKKPDKILPCPRCNSLDTKFCYYNNYNVNQPRHFCKNCQRYWTAGGTMRNVPVGAGRRKNKNSAYRHVTMSDICLQAARSDVPQSMHHPPSKPNGTVLSFGSDTPLSESMASVLNIAEKNMKNCHRNGFHRKEEKIIPFSCGVENDDEQSSGSLVTPSKSNEEGTRANLQEPRIQNPQGIPAPIPCFNGSTWPYPWSPAPAFCTSSLPIPFYPASAYWGCTVPGPWTIPWLSPVAASSPKGDSSGSGPNSPNLGKHSREGDVFKHGSVGKGDDVKQNKQEKCLWIPKTLRIDNPDEAARSSIWAMVGVKNGKTDAASGGRLFKAFHPKSEIKNHRVEASQILHANPAALSRSLGFQESS